MTNTEQKIYAVIVTWNAMRNNWIDHCLQSLSESLLPVTPVVVDNGSSDGTRERVPQKWPGVIWMPQDKNLGFGQANNLGIAYAYQHGATHILLLNQDAWVRPDTLSRLVEIQDRENLAIVAPIHLSGDGKRLDRGFYNEILKSADGYRFISDMMLHTPCHYYKAKEIPAAAWLLSRNTVETIGGFDPLFFQYGEDTDYTLRLEYHQLFLAVIPDAFICHDRRDTHGNEKVYNAVYVKNKLRNSFCDINQSVLAPTTYRLKVLVSHSFLALKYLATLKLKQWWLITIAYLSFISEIPTIIRHRRVNKKIGMHWLNIKRTGQK